MEIAARRNASHSRHQNPIAVSGQKSKAVSYLFPLSVFSGRQHLTEIGRKQATSRRNLKSCSKTQPEIASSMTAKLRPRSVEDVDRDVRTACKWCRHSWKPRRFIPFSAWSESPRLPGGLTTLWDVFGHFQHCLGHSCAL